MALEIVDLLEAIEVNADNGDDAFALGGGGDGVLQLAGEAGAVEDTRQRVVVSEEPDMLFGLLARAEIAHRDSLMRLAAEVHLAKDHFDREPIRADADLSLD